MIEFINSIPDYIGWMIAGMLGTVNIIMNFQIDKNKFMK